MARSGRIQGTTTVRPWRLGVLVDANSLEEVKNVVASLSGVWGGYYCLLFDRATSGDELAKLSEIHDVDSLYDSKNGEFVSSRMDRPGYEWPSGFFEPITSSSVSGPGGLLATEELLRATDSAEFVFPMWSKDDPADMIHVMNWGRSGELEDNLPACVSVAELGLLPVRMNDFDHVGPLQASRLGITLSRREAEAYRGLCIVDQDDCASLVGFWNMRASGAKVLAVSRSIDPIVWSFLSANLREFSSEVVRGTRPVSILSIYNSEIANASTKTKLKDWASERNIELIEDLATLERHPTWQTRSITKTLFRGGFSSNFQADQHGLDIPVPYIPWSNSSRAKNYLGCVAVEVVIKTESSLDPSRTAKLPFYRKLSPLMRSRTGGGTICHARVGPGGTAFLVSANEESIWYPFPRNLAVIASLFDESTSALERINQSDVGKFHSRTAAILGGHSSTAAQEPGVRAVLKLAAVRASGITTTQVRNTVLRDRANWPRQQISAQSSAMAYAQGRAEFLLQSGLLVPFMNVSCNLCGVTSQIHPKELDAQISCTYCGEMFQLASSLHNTKPTWKLKLAGHLPAQKMESALPVLATLATLSQLVVGGGGSLCHALGVELKYAGHKPVEMDILAFVGDHGSPALVGEVKTANKIDQHDIDNVGLVVTMLRESSVRAMPIFVTMKERFAEDEVELLREYSNRAAYRSPLLYESIPALPLALVGTDVSMPWLDQRHPFNWPVPSYAQGIWGIALQSCRRNLGLSSYELVRGEGQGRFGLTWD